MNEKPGVDIMIDPESFKKAGEMLEKATKGLEDATEQKLHDMLKPAEALRALRSEIKPCFSNLYANMLKDFEARAQKFDLVIAQFEHLLDLWEKAKDQIEIKNMTLTSLGNPEEIISFAGTNELQTFIERWKSDQGLQKKHLEGNPYRLKIEIKDYV